MEIRECL